MMNINHGNLRRQDQILEPARVRQQQKLREQLAQNLMSRAPSGPQPFVGPKLPPPMPGPEDEGVYQQIKKGIGMAAEGAQQLAIQSQNIQQRVVQRRRQQQEILMGSYGQAFGGYNQPYQQPYQQGMDQGYDRRNIMSLTNANQAAQSYANKVLQMPLSQTDTQLLNALSPQKVDITLQPLTYQTPIAQIQSYSLMPSLNAIYMDWMTKIIRKSTEINPKTGKQYVIKYKNKDFTYFDVLNLLRKHQKKKTIKFGNTGDSYQYPPILSKLDLLMQVFSSQQVRQLSEGYRKMLLRTMLEQTKRLLIKVRYNANPGSLLDILLNQYALAANVVSEGTIPSRLDNVIADRIQQSKKICPLSTSQYAKVTLDKLLERNKLEAKYKYESLLAQEGKYINEKDKIHKGMFQLVPKNYQGQLQSLYKKFYVQSQKA